MPKYATRKPFKSWSMRISDLGATVGPGLRRKTDSMLGEVENSRTIRGRGSLASIKRRMKAGNFSIYAEQYAAAGLTRATALRYEITRLKKLDANQIQDGKKRAPSNPNAIRAQAERNIARVYD